MSDKYTPKQILKYIRLAMHEAERARGMCSPNPFVGAVIVKDGSVIATGHTQAYGKDHAEVVALKKAGTHARGADMFVTLQPCSHWGKTPPCTDAIIKAGIAGLWFGIPDPNPQVNAEGMAPGTISGIQSMLVAGITVSWGYMEEEIKRQLEYHLCRIQKQRPFVILKSALSLDGKYAAMDGSSRWISGEESRKAVHQLRETVDVVMAGIATVMADDPLFTVRLPHPKRQPLRAVLDTELAIDPNSALIQSIDEAPIIIFHQKRLSAMQKQKVAGLKEQGVELLPISSHQGRLVLDEVLQELHQRGFYSVLIESAGGLAASFIAENLVDKFIFFLAPKLLGGGMAALKALQLNNIKDALDLEITDCQYSGKDIMITAYPRY
ncbi:MAG: bifunctional diaminohydroxyphosphoribosylaminopyrimidine deaminase/5-amino-6-(5-phosphoribosylamino)uracil reductase RibD [Candidatus Cloacimonetes bacterium]|nr:bifunctional diaminohydroxyphosphoribosylaminopyrimidine deaminase/5-amino-6-(5-phosphoribosylamino)uracil reductase RibD [Candidatus Cloacimonadota bacterium]